MKKILIFGGAGFIGSNLIERLIDKNQIYCVDNLSTGSISNIKKFLSLKNFSFVNSDITEKINIQADEIYNLACMASPVHYQKDPIKTIKTSVLGTLNLLEIAKKYNSKLLFSSTSEVYGNPLIHPQNEEYFGNVNPNGIRACYDEGKRLAETILSDYNRIYNTKIKIARIFNTYGKNMSKQDGRVICNFVISALKNEDITIYGNGTQTRSFCYIDDLIEGLIKLMKSDDKINYPINLGCDEEHKIIDLAEIIIQKTNSKSKIIYKNLPQDDPIKRKPNISKAKNILNWTPKINLSTGLDKTIEYFKGVI